jgi:hypothetical protein
MLVEEIKIEQLNKLMTLTGADNEREAKEDAKVKVIKDESGAHVVMYGDKKMLMYDDIAKESPLKIKVFDRCLNEKEAEEKKMENLTQQLNDINSAVNLAENPEDINNLNDLLGTIKKELSLTFYEILTKYLADAILDCDKKLTYDDMNSAGF